MAGGNLNVTTYWTGYDFVPAVGNNDPTLRKMRSTLDPTIDANDKQAGDFTEKRTAAGQIVWFTKDGAELFDRVGNLNFNGPDQVHWRWIADVNRDGQGVLLFLSGNPETAIGDPNAKPKE